MAYVARYLDGDSNTVDQIKSPDAREVEAFVRRVATHIVIVDDARHEGTGDFVAGSIEWFTEP